MCRSRIEAEGVALLNQVISSLEHLPEVELLIQLDRLTMVPSLKTVLLRHGSYYAVRVGKDRRSGIYLEW